MSHQLISKWVPSLYDAATDGLTFAWAKQTLAKYDRANIFTNDCEKPRRVRSAREGEHVEP